MAALAAIGVAATPTPLSPLGLRVDGRAAAGDAALLSSDGLVEVQDEGSQLAALLVDARPGMRVVDFCAGAGGKTLAHGGGDGEQGPHRRLRRAARPGRSRGARGCSAPASTMWSAAASRPSAIPG